MSMKIVAIINGKNRNAEKIKSDAQQVFANDFNVKYLVTEQNQARQMAKDAVIDGADVIIAAGGDGTLHEIANGILQTNLEITKLPVIAPFKAGTGNDLARTIKFGNNWQNLKQKILENQWQIMDTAEITYRTFEGNTAKRFFINITDLGIGAQSIKLMSSKKTLNNGSLTYAMSALTAFVCQKAAKLKITCDNFEYHGLVTELCVGNGKYFGGGFGISPYSDPFDAKLELLIVKNMNTARFIPIMKKMRDASPIMINEFLYKRINYCKIESLDNHQHIVESDGELLGTTPIEIKFVPAVLKIFANIK